MLVVLRVSPRVAAGQLTWPAWSALRSADEVWAVEPSPGWVAALASGGVALSSWGDRSAAELVERAAGRSVVLLDDGGEAVAGVLAEAGPYSVVVGAADLLGARLLDLVAVMDRLRSPGGCPWDAAQSHHSLLPYLLEETYETVEAIESGDPEHLREELGDLLLQVVFHARVAAEDPSAPWGIDEVADGIVAKLVARHPHVFGSVDATTAEQVEANWEELKRAEKGRESAMDGVPLAQPALALAAKLMSRAEKAGVGVSVPMPAVPSASSASPEVIGELLLGVVALARAAGVDPEAALREAARGYAGRVRAAEASPAPPAG